MSPLNIEFSPSTIRRGLSLRPWALCLALSGAALGSWAVTKAERIQQQIEVIQTRANVLEASTSAHVAAHRPPPASPEAQVQAVNRAIRRLNLPWWDLFASLQRSATPKVALLVLEPDASTFTLKGEAEAADPGAMLTYVETLRHDRFFTAVILTHHEVDATDPNTPLRFKFEAAWRGEQ